MGKETFETWSSEEKQSFDDEFRNKTIDRRMNYNEENRKKNIQDPENDAIGGFDHDLSSSEKNTAPSEEILKNDNEKEEDLTQEQAYSEMGKSGIVHRIKEEIKSLDDSNAWETQELRDRVHELFDKIGASKFDTDKGKQVYDYKEHLKIAREIKELLKGSGNLESEEKKGNNTDNKATSKEKKGSQKDSGVIENSKEKFSSVEIKEINKELHVGEDGWWDLKEASMRLKVIRFNQNDGRVHFEKMPDNVIEEIQVEEMTGKLERWREAIKNHGGEFVSTNKNIKEEVTGKKLEEGVDEELLADGLKAVEKPLGEETLDSIEEQIAQIRGDKLKEFEKEGGGDPKVIEELTKKQEELEAKKEQLQNSEQVGGIDSNMSFENMSDNELQEEFVKLVKERNQIILEEINNENGRLQELDVQILKISDTLKDRNLEYRTDKIEKELKDKEENQEQEENSENKELSEEIKKELVRVEELINNLPNLSDEEKDTYGKKIKKIGYCYQTIDNVK